MGQVGLRRSGTLGPMPWAPLDEDWVGDPRLDPYRRRAGVLLDEAGERVGDSALEVLETWTRAGGHLWWSRWAPGQEVVHVRTRLDDGSSDRWVTSGERLEEDLAAWEDGVLQHGGGRYRVVWQDDEESARVLREVFGLG